MNFLFSLLAGFCCLLQLQTFVLPAFASSSHFNSQRQSEFVDDLWSGRLNEPYLTAHVSRLSNSHVLCDNPSAPFSLVFSRGPTGATYGIAHVNASFDSELAASSDEQLRTPSARHQRLRKAKGTVKLNIVLTDAETAKRVDVRSPLLFTSAEYGRACL